MDRGCLRAAELTEQKAASLPGYANTQPVIPPGLSNKVASLLIETHAASEAQLQQRAKQALQSISSEFTTDPVLYTKYWNVRKGLIPLVGGHRPKSTSIIIEDVAVTVPQLAPFTLDLQTLFAKYGYDDAIVFGHALAGNLHLLFSQGFTHPEMIDRYHVRRVHLRNLVTHTYTNKSIIQLTSACERAQQLMDEMCRMVASDYGGSLKAEHGTGRNVAPFVELEWGSDAYAVMERIKRLFDFDDILNPGVLLNSDPLVHIKNLKHMAVAHEAIDNCIECGFCERVCPSRELTLTPRQRIVTWREISRLRAIAPEQRTPEEQQFLQQLERSFEYDGEATCAADGMCSTRCPVSSTFDRTAQRTVVVPCVTLTARLVATHHHHRRTS